jgi:hypothetical protein
VGPSRATSARQDWRQYFALGTDRTHTNPAGAEIIAGFVRDAVVGQQIDLATNLR